MRNLVTASVPFLLAMTTTVAVAQEPAFDPEDLVATTECLIGNGDCAQWRATWVQNITGISAGTSWTIEEDNISNGCVLTAQASGMGPATINFSVTCSETMDGTAESLNTHLFFVEGEEIYICEGQLMGGTSLPLGDLDIDCEGEENELEVALLKKSDGIGGFVYGISLGASKIGATTCKLTTPSGTFVCPESGDEFSLEWTDLSFNEIQTETALDWTLTLDEGLATETVATLDLGFGTTALSADDFPPVPRIVDPVDGAMDVSASTSVTWTSDSFEDAVEVCLDGPNFVEISSDDLAASARSWTPPDPLEAGSWLASVFNFVDIRDVPVGITVMNDPWVLDNFDWASLESVGNSTFVVPEPREFLLHGISLLTLVFLRRGSARVTL